MILACLFVKDSTTKEVDNNLQGKAYVQQVHLFNTEKYEDRPFSIFSIEDHDLTAEIRQLKFSPDGQVILLGTTENLILLIDSFEGNIKNKF